MITLHIEAPNMEALRSMALLQLGLDGTASIPTCAAAAPKKAKKVEEAKVEEPKAEPKAEEVKVEPKAPIDPDGFPTLQLTREATFRYMTKKNEQIAKAPSVMALMGKYNAKLLTDIKPEERAAYIAECDA